MNTTKTQWKFSDITGYAILTDGVNVFGEVYLMMPGVYYQAWAIKINNTKDFDGDKHDEAKAWVEQQLTKGGE